MDLIKIFSYSCLIANNLCAPWTDLPDPVRDSIETLALHCCDIKTGLRIPCTLRMFVPTENMMFAGHIECPLLKDVYCILRLLVSTSNGYLTFTGSECATWEETPAGEYQIQLNGVPFSAFPDYAFQMSPYAFGTGLISILCFSYVIIKYLTGRNDYEPLAGEDQLLVVQPGSDNKIPLDSADDQSFVGTQLQLRENQLPKNGLTPARVLGEVVGSNDVKVAKNDDDPGQFKCTDVGGRPRFSTLMPISASSPGSVYAGDTRWPGSLNVTEYVGNELTENPSLAGVTRSETCDNTEYHEETVDFDPPNTPSDEECSLLARLLDTTEKMTDMQKRELPLPKDLSNSSFIVRSASL